MSRYDTIGVGYARTRREDPSIRAAIHAALGDAASVVNVGAGAGSYEPSDRPVLAVEPSAVMADAEQERGVRELRRVARGPVVIVMVDPEVCGRMWLFERYLVEVAEMDRRIFPSLEQLAAWLGPGSVRVQTVPIPRDSPDWNLMSFWAHPERVLDAEARAGTSGFSRQPREVVERVLAELTRDLADGSWDRRWGGLRAQASFDAGLRLMVHRPPRRPSTPEREEVPESDTVPACSG